MELSYSTIELIILYHIITLTTHTLYIHILFMNYKVHIIEKILAYDVFGKSTGITTLNMWLALRHEIYISWDAKRRTTWQCQSIVVFVFWTTKNNFIKSVPMDGGLYVFLGRTSNLLCFFCYCIRLDWVGPFEIVN